MYKVYFTDPQSQAAFAIDTEYLKQALKYTENLREQGMLFVTLVTDYEHMTGSPGAKMAGSEYVPQLKS